MVRVFGDDGLWAYSSTLIDAAYNCRDAGANIISMSLGGSRSNRTEMNGFNTLYNTNGILSIAAASNEGTTAYAYPASYDSVVSVAAIDANKQWADFSQYNNQVELAAPGVGVLSTVPYLDASSVTVDGVTYAANHIEFSARGTTTVHWLTVACATPLAPGLARSCSASAATYDFYAKVITSKQRWRCGSDLQQRSRQFPGHPGRGQLLHHRRHQPEPGRRPSTWSPTSWAAGYGFKHLHRTRQQLRIL